MAQVTWSDEAKANLRAIFDYVAEDSSDVAQRLVEDIASVRQLADFPSSGRTVPELEDRGVREVILRPYRVAYRHRDDIVEILKVWHGRRLLHEADINLETTE